MRLKNCLMALLLSAPVAAMAGEVQVAVAANFTKPMQQIAAEFAKQTGHEVKLSFGSSGKFVAQITHGAPFEVFLSADQTKPEALVAAGLAVESTRFTYALGKLALWSADATLVDAGGEVLKGNVFRHIALADAKLAPYGAAALETLDKLGLNDALGGKIVQGENISQTFQFVKTGNAELGFVALSQVFQNGRVSEGSVWMVPEGLYQPIRQDAVLLKTSHDNPAAGALLDYLRGPEARAIIESFGYSVAY